MKMLRAFRVIGDNVSCYFAPNGALTSAMLVVDGGSRMVSNQLPGCRADNVVEYLEFLGFHREYDDTCLAIGSEVQATPRPAGLSVESVVRCEGGFLLSIIRDGNRTLVCPRREFLVKHLTDGDELLTLSVKSHSLAAVFSKFVSNMGS